MEILHDSEKLRLLADWIDKEQANGRWDYGGGARRLWDYSVDTEVQDDLRRLAKQLEYHKIGVTVDCCLFNIKDDESYILLVQRGDNSKAFPGAWAIPGGFLNEDERLVTGSVRELEEETRVKIDGNNLNYPGLIYVGVFDDPKRDPRQRVMSHVYAGWSHHQVKPEGHDDAQDARWFRCQDLPENMAFDHRDIIREAYLKLLSAGSSDFTEGR